MRARQTIYIVAAKHISIRVKQLCVDCHYLICCILYYFQMATFHVDLKQYNLFACSFHTTHPTEQKIYDIVMIALCFMKKTFEKC